VTTVKRSQSAIWLLALIVITGCASVLLAQESSASNAPRGPYIVAHRGSSTDRPENTLAAYQRAIQASAHAIEIDLRLTLDGHLVSLHDATVDRTTNGSGEVASMPLAEVQALDAGSWFHPRFAAERVPTFKQILALAGDRVDVFLDLKDDGGSEYEQKVVETVRNTAYPERIVFGVRSARAARYYLGQLPNARLCGLIPRPEDLESFADAGVPVIRLWPHWLPTAGLLQRLRDRRLKLLVSAGKGSPEETRPVLDARPEWLFVDDPARLIRTLGELNASN
jgi:glycerophosphoryl diester phosphodiesterase